MDAPSGRRSQDRLDGSTSSKRLLLVQPDPHLRANLRLLLERQGYKVQVAPAASATIVSTIVAGLTSAPSTAARASYSAS